MRATVNSITGFEDAFAAMYMSKRSWTPELDHNIRDVCTRISGACATGDDYAEFDGWLEKLLRMGQRHITLLRFIDIAIMTEGMHRGGQDDIDAHARRFDNRIIRSSTRLATFGDNEVSDWYRDKIIPTDRAMQILGFDIPETIVVEGEKYVKSQNGYVKKEYAEDKDVKRGLYMLSIPSNFVSKINLCEWSHVFQERNRDGGANPEVKEWAESVMAGITKAYPLITRKYVLGVKN